ncbi:subtilase family protein [Nitrosomonas nitrosa]|uniref:S8 family serine peptidase n=1 Tax=Nitrosomonas nitrosa TaxID=52442 RepID=UPI000D3F64AC|nr:S8 family serine peptidase [Nitrosomonas nitrosa]PTQ98831.1 subtilase family protein [Nitrosomonas nitrosa]
MASIHFQFPILNSDTSRISANHMRTNQSFRLWQLFCATVLAALMGLTPSFSSAAPPAHANNHAKNNFFGETLPESARSKRNESEEWAKGRILVMPRAGLPAQALAKILKEHNGKHRKIGQSDLYIVDLPEYTEEGVIARLAHHPHLKFAELDRAVPPSLAPNDPYYPNGWHLPKIGSPTAWDSSQGAGITIAILDSGVDGSHPDLAAKMVPGWNFYNNNSNTADVRGHGTKVAGAAAAITNNGTGVAGIAGQAKIMPIRVADAEGYGYDSLIIQGLTYAADKGARVANASYLGLSSSSAVQNAALYMKNKGGLVTVSGGNSGRLESFAATSTMIPIAATDGNDNRTSWSSYGNYIALAAPGAGIWTTFIGGGYGSVNGTSFSSPITAGVIALMMAANPKMKNTDIEKILFTTAKDLGTSGWDPYFGHGRVDAAAAVQAVVAAAPVVDTEAPQVAIIDPLSDATVSGLVPVDIEATDNIGVVRAELWVNNTSVAVDTSSPFAFTWDSQGVANGPAHLIVYAFDDAGNSAASNIVEVNVNNQVVETTNDTVPPAVEIVNPVAGNVSGNVTITANASDNASAAEITQSIYLNGKLLASGSGSTLSTNWNTRPRSVSRGTHTIQVVAKDKAGNTTTSSVDVNVVK